MNDGERRGWGLCDLFMGSSLLPVVIKWRCREEKVIVVSVHSVLIFLILSYFLNLFATKVMQKIFPMNWPSQFRFHQC